VVRFMMSRKLSLRSNVQIPSSEVHPGGRVVCDSQCRFEDPHTRKPSEAPIECGKHRV